jgi:hypothetical protein
MRRYAKPRDRGEIVNPHVFPHVPDPHHAALLQLMDWCAEEMKRRNRGECICPTCGLRHGGRNFDGGF